MISVLNELNVMKEQFLSQFRLSWNIPPPKFHLLHHSITKGWFQIPMQNCFVIASQILLKIQISAQPCSSTSQTGNLLPLVTACSKIKKNWIQLKHTRSKSFRNLESKAMFFNQNHNSIEDAQLAPKLVFIIRTWIKQLID